MIQDRRAALGGLGGESGEGGIRRSLFALDWGNGERARIAVDQRRQGGAPHLRRVHYRQGDSLLRALVSQLH